MKFSVVNPFATKVFTVNFQISNQTEEVFK